MPALEQSDEQRTRLAAELIRWMAEPLPAPDAAPEEERFNRLALAVFAYQFAANAPYQRYCERRGITPARLTRWQEIPAVATDAFKEAPLTCFPVEQAAAVFITSGTTLQAKRGTHYLRSLDLYRAAALPNFVAHLLPDAARMPAVILAFSPDDMPRSSLSHMFGMVVAQLTSNRNPAAAALATAGDRGDGRTYFVGPAGVDIEGAAARLSELAGAGQPVLLMGTAFAFVHLLDHLAERGRTIPLPPGSRIMDTGGYKGRSRALPKDDLYDLYDAVLNVPPSHIVNEYGMTEMSSQFYDGGLRRATAGDPATPRRKVVPPWVRTVVVDPQTLQPLPAGQTGLLRHHDLANLDSVAALQTADLGHTVGPGFEITGRAAGAEARGCSLAVEELLAAQRR